MMTLFLVALTLTVRLEAKKKSNTFLVDVESKETSQVSGDYRWHEGPFDGCQLDGPKEPQDFQMQQQFRRGGYIL